MDELSNNNSEGQAQAQVPVMVPEGHIVVDVRLLPYLNGRYTAATSCGVISL
jgi:hypothetical protein